MATMLAPARLLTRLLRAIKGRIAFSIAGVLTFMPGGLTTGSTEPPVVPVATGTTSFTVAQIEIIVLEPDVVSGLGVTARQIQMAFDESPGLQDAAVNYECTDAVDVGEHWRISCEADSGPRSVVELFGPQPDEEDEEPPLARDTPLARVTMFMGVSSSPDEAAKAFAAVVIVLTEIFPGWNSGIINLSEWMLSGVAEQEIARDGKRLSYSNQIAARGGVVLSFEPQLD